MLGFSSFGSSSSCLELCMRELTRNVSIDGFYGHSSRVCLVWSWTFVITYEFPQLVHDARDDCVDIVDLVTQDD